MRQIESRHTARAYLQGGMNVLRTLRIRSKQLLVLLVFGFMGVALTGCGDSGSPFVQTPTVSFLSGGTVVPPGGLVTVGLLLDRPAPKSISVGLLAIDDAGVFEVPASVGVSAGQSAAVFEVGAASAAGVGERLSLRMLAGEDYAVGANNALTFTVGDTQLPVVSLEGGDQFVAQGGEASFSVLRSVPVGDVDVKILATPSNEGFTIPSSVTITAGADEALFQVGATGVSGTVDISILPPEGYVLGASFTATITIE
jgi:hypothetical protein